jgi:general stress protein YciG
LNYGSASKSVTQVQIGRFTVNNSERKERRGFASMSPEKQREIASKGGRAAHEKGTAHEWTADEARSAGRKGGQVSRGGRGRLVVPTETSAVTTDATPSVPTGNAAEN